MSTQLILAPATRTWEQLSTAISESLDDLLTGSVSQVRVTVPGGGQHVIAALIGDGQIRLAAAGNDTLVGGDRLTVRDERAAITVGFKVGSDSWGNFYWDWSSPVDSELVASGIIRTMRDIYKVESNQLELTVTL